MRVHYVVDLDTSERAPVARSSERAPRLWAVSVRLSQPSERAERAV